MMKQWHKSFASCDAPLTAPAWQSWEAVNIIAFTKPFKSLSSKTMIVKNCWMLPVVRCELNSLFQPVIVSFCRVLTHIVIAGADESKYDSSETSPVLTKGTRT